MKKLVCALDETETTAKVALGIVINYADLLEIAVTAENKDKWGFPRGRGEDS